MAKKSKKMAATYGKKSTTLKKKRPVNQTVQSSEATVAPLSDSNTPVVPPEPQVRAISRPAAGKSYNYVMADVKKVAVIAVVLFIILIVLSFVL